MSFFKKIFSPLIEVKVIGKKPFRHQNFNAPKIKSEPSIKDVSSITFEDYNLSRVAFSGKNPSSSRLQKNYENLVSSDPHLTANIYNRIYRITGQNYAIKDSNGDVDSEKTKLIKTKWFDDIVWIAMESIFYGYSVMMPLFSKEGKIKKIKLFDRGICIPQKQQIEIDIFKWINYAKFPEYIWEANFARNYFGILETAAVYSIAKKLDMSYWVNYAQKFGMPTLVGYTENRDLKYKKDFIEWLHNLGQSGATVIEEDSDRIESLETKKTDAHKLFLEAIELCNKEISKLINGQTMTSDDGSSNKQATVHLITQDQITFHDKKQILNFLNTVVLPNLRLFNYDIPENYSIGIIDSKDPKEQMEFDKVMMQSGYNLDKEYLTKTYGTEFDKNLETKQKDKIDAKNKTLIIKGKKKRTISKQVKKQPDLFSKTIVSYFGKKIEAKTSNLIDDQKERLREAFFNKKVKENYLDMDLYKPIFTKAMDGLETGYGTSLSKLKYTDTKFAKLSSLREDTAKFFANKQLAFNKKARAIRDTYTTEQEFADYFNTSFDANYKEYLGIELDHVARAGTDAKRWEEIISDKEILPNLKYVAVNDGRTRASHAAWNGVILPVSDPFWITHNPANDWGCRCGVVQTDAKVDKRNVDFSKLNTTGPFANNPGITGKLFNNHPYDKEVAFDKLHIKRMVSQLQSKDIIKKNKAYSSQIKSIIGHPFSDLRASVFRQADLLYHIENIKQDAKIDNNLKGEVNKKREGRVQKVYFKIVSIDSIEWLLTIFEYSEKEMKDKIHAFRPLKEEEKE